jgi:hypothetical protein
LAGALDENDDARIGGLAGEVEGKVEWGGCEAGEAADPLERSDDRDVLQGAAAVLAVEDMSGGHGLDQRGEDVGVGDVTGLKNEGRGRGNVAVAERGL